MSSLKVSDATLLLKTPKDVVIQDIRGGEEGYDITPVILFKT
jgi:hypothetical protein